MKKRKILVSLALASAALFSLAACNKTESTPTPTPAPTSAPAPATSTAPAASSTPAAASSSQAASSSSQAASTQKTVSFIAKYSDGADEKELTDLTQTVEAGSTITAPTAPEETGYKFIKYTTLSGLDVDFTKPIDKNVELYANYDKLTQYHTMLAQAEAAGVTLALAEDFNSISNLPTEKTAGRVSLYDASEGDAKVDIVDFKAELTTDINDKKSAVNVDFDTIQTESTITGYFEMKISAFKKDMFLHFKGKSGENNDYKILSMGMESDGRLRFKYDNEGSEKTSGFNTTFKLSEDNNVIVYRIDTISKTIAIRVNDTEIINYDYASNATFEGLNKVTIQCLADTKNHTTYTTYLNNMYVNVEQANMEQARSEAIATVNAFTSNAKYQYAQAAVDAIIAKYTNATTGELVTADSIAAISTKLNAAKAELADAIKDVTVTVKYYSAANTTIGDNKDKSLTTALGKTYTAEDLELAGYAIKGLYTDAALETAYTGPTTDAANQTIYVKVEESTLVKTVYTYADADKNTAFGHSTDAEDKAVITTQQLKDALKGKVDGTAVTTKFDVSVVGETLIWRKGSNGIEITNASSNGIEFNFAGTGKITLLLCSTGGSNTSYFGLLDKDGNIVTATAKDSAFGTSDGTETEEKDGEQKTVGVNGYYKVAGSTGKEITYTITTAGKYTLSSATVRNLRIKGIVVEETK